VQFLRLPWDIPFNSSPSHSASPFSALIHPCLCLSARKNTRHEVSWGAPTAEAGGGRCQRSAGTSRTRATFSSPSFARKARLQRPPAPSSAIRTPNRRRNSSHGPPSTRRYRSLALALAIAALVLAAAVDAKARDKKVCARRVAAMLMSLTPRQHVRCNPFFCAEPTTTPAGGEEAHLPALEAPHSRKASARRQGHSQGGQSSHEQPPGPDNRQQARHAEAEAAHRRLVRCAPCVAKAAWSPS